jgi:hypothetical protein
MLLELSLYAGLLLMKYFLNFNNLMSELTLDVYLEEANKISRLLLILSSYVGVRNSYRNTIETRFETSF